MTLNIYYTILIALCGSIVKSQDICQTHDNEKGTCISIYHCGRLAKLIQDTGKPESPYTTYFLGRISCGIRNGVRYICCPDKHTTTTATTANSTPTITPTTTPNTNPTNSTTTTIPENLSPKFSNTDSTEFEKIEDFSNHPNLNLLPKTCGLTTVNKVSNGQKTSLNQYPFMALLKYDTNDGFDFKCGGTIINERYILTAAHCFSKRGGKVTAVRVGEHVISTSTDCENSGVFDFCAPPVEDIAVEAIIIHPNYNKPLFANDIALIRLERDINFENSNMKAVCLPINKKAQQMHLKNVITTGWGHIDRKNRSDILLSGELPVVELDKCQKVYKSNKILESMICAGGENQTDTCSGDSGGPIFFPTKVDKAVRHVQYGVVSYGYSICGSDTNHPGMYTKVTHFMKWILDQLRT